MSLREVFDRCAAALQKGDFAAIGAMLDPDFVLHEAPSLPYAGTYHGIDGWRAVSRAVVTTWTDFKFEPIAVYEAPETLIVNFAISGRSRKTGRPFATTVLEIWRFRGERLREIVPYYWDTAELAAIDAAAPA